uniref:Uncharacterized protein n=1 Tax=Amphora coffeiformis TaxID=265554 RepID=A0A7S3P5F2_9STRA
MRDYNTIKFRSPRKVKDHPLVVEDEKKEGSAASTAASTPPVSTQRKQQSNNNNAASPRSPPPGGSSSVISGNSSSVMSVQDALQVRREGAEATIVRLRSALDESSQKDTTAKAALAKSDAVILELRSSVRQLKRQLEKVQQEKEELDQQRQQQRPRDGGTVSESDSAMDVRVGELQVQLDRAHAQILTADMVRKELEDTLEAEQYTWELRVQDQERQIQELQQDCAALVADLEAVRGQWKESEETWSKQVEELKTKLNQAQKEATHWRSAPRQSDSEETSHLKEKLRSLENERSELQGCLDEALKELEAVDAELQGDPVQQLREENEQLHKMLQNGGDSVTLAEPLQHLYRMVLERDGIEEDVHSKPRDARSLIVAIQSHIDRSPMQNSDLSETRQQVRELEAQLSVYKGDLKAREESTQELRASLKEAVSLLKPLQDAVARADREKVSLQKQIQELKQSSVNGDHVKELQDELRLKEMEIERLRQEVETLEMALTRAKAMAASSAVAASKAAASDTPDSVSSARAKLRQRRAEEDQIRQMLKDAQSRFHSLHEQNQQAETRNLDLQNQLDSKGKALISPHSGDIDEEKKEWDRDSSLEDLRDELTIARGELSKKEVEMRNLEKELEAERYKRNNLGEDDAVALREARSRVDFLESKLDSTTSELKAKKESEKALNASLKEALNLLRPLQTHLEEAEREKREMAKELMALKKINQSDPSARNTSMPSDADTNHVRDLEYAVQQLEKENSQLHDALEDMSHSINASHLSGTTNLSNKNDARLREELVEMKSRYEVTQSRLEDAFVENHTLVEALQKREKEEREMVEELYLLRQKLKQSQSELERTRSGQSGGGSTFSGYSQSSRERSDRAQAPPPGSFPYGPSTTSQARSAQKHNPNYWE